MVLTKVYSIGGEEPTNNPPTSARQPEGLMTYAGLHVAMQNLGIKSPRDNNPGLLGGGAVILGALGLTAGGLL